jgi:hypothetical protein
MQRMQQQPLRGRCPTRLHTWQASTPLHPNKSPLHAHDCCQPILLTCQGYRPAATKSRRQVECPTVCFGCQHGNIKGSLLCPASASFSPTTLNSSFPLKESIQAGVLQHYALLTYVSTAEALHKVAIPTHRHHTEPRTQRNQGTTPRHTLAQSQ